MTQSLILALDLGTKTGYAFRTPEGAIASGVFDLKPQRFEGGGMRFIRFVQYLRDVANSHPAVPMLVFFEEVRRHAGVDAAHVYGGLMATLTTWCETNVVPYRGVPVGTIKKFWAGKGNADKAAMMREAGARGFAPVDHNEADALALLHWAISNHM